MKRSIKCLLGTLVVFLGSQSALASMVCYPKDNSARILSSPAPNDIHPNWQGESYIGLSSSLIPLGTVKDWSTNQYYINGKLYSSRGGFIEIVYVLAKEWNCESDSEIKPPKELTLSPPAKKAAPGLAGPFEDGNAAYKRGDYAKAVALYRKAAEQGSAKDQLMLGTMYEFGKGVPQDYAESVKWHRKAAEQGHALAQFSLGVAYKDGKGVPQNYAEALKWYRLAAEQGQAVFQIALAAIYHHALLGVPQNYAEALKWYRLAAEQGDAGAQVGLGIMYSDGQGVPQNYAEAVKWYRLAAEQGNAGAQIFLANKYEVGEGVPQDSAQAMKWSRKAADQGDAMGQRMVGEMYLRGKDDAEAAKWFRKAAEQGNAVALIKIGLMYATGRGVLQDFVKAHMWFNIAAALGVADARKNRDKITRFMNTDQIAEAQRLAREWKPKK